jgi:hypothetical protein
MQPGKLPDSLKAEIAPGVILAYFLEDLLSGYKKKIPLLSQHALTTPGPILVHCLKHFKCFKTKEKSLEDLDVKSKQSSERSTETLGVFFSFLFLCCI